MNTIFSTFMPPLLFCAIVILAHISSRGIPSPADQRSGLHTPTSGEHTLATVRDGAFDTSLGSFSEPGAFGDLRQSQTEQNDPESQELSPNDMIAPVSAMHSMSVNLLGPSNVGILSILTYRA